MVYIDSHLDLLTQWVADTSQQRFTKLTLIRPSRFVSYRYINNAEVGTEMTFVKQPEAHYANNDITYSPLKLIT